jgi:hypothetical protein
MTDNQDQKPAANHEWLVEALCHETPHAQKLLLLGVRRDGSNFTYASGIEAGEERTMAIHFETWLNAKDPEAETE